MPTIAINIYSSNNVTTEMVGHSRGKLIAERIPRTGNRAMGYGGGEILTLAAGACFLNNLRLLADDWGVNLKNIEVEVVAVTSDAAPMIREITIKPRIESDASENEIQDLVNQALQESYVADMLINNVSVKLEAPTHARYSDGRSELPLGLA